MPTLIAGGPDIPTTILQALEDDELVLFCGAGVSVPAGLPTFKKLAEILYDAVGEEPKPEERISIKAGQLDRALGMLERKLNPGVLRRQVNEELRLSHSADLTIHKAILDLTKHPNGGFRLVTTNFDNAFEMAGCSEQETDSAPKLPVPKPSTWRSLVHLHGRIYPGQTERDDVVLTSADFGRAYLSEGWASRFVTELFRHFTVLFIGYSVDDPVMRYLTDALTAERERVRGIKFRQAYAFAGISGRQRERKSLELQWNSKSVEVIFYDARRRHINLRNTLIAWADMHRLGLQSKLHIIRRHAQEPPREGIIDDVARRVVWALSDSSGAAATEFAKIEPAPPLDWLQVFEHTDFKNVNLLGTRTPDAANASLVSNGYSSNRLFEVAKVTEQLAYWLSRHLRSPELLDWVLRKGGWLHPTLRHFVRNALQEPDLPTSLHQAWEILSSDSFAEAFLRQFTRRLNNLERLIQKPFSPNSRVEIIEILTPTPRLRARTSFLGDPLPYPSATEGRIHDFINVDVRLAGGETTRYFLQFVLLEAANREDVLFSLANDLTSLLAQALQWLSWLEFATPQTDGSHHYIPTIGVQDLTQFDDDWPQLINLTWQSFLVASKRDERLANALLARWRVIRFPVFRRLLLHATTEVPTLDVSAAMEILLDYDAEVLWNESTRREVLGFLRMAHRLKNTHTKRLWHAIKKGPPEEWSPDFPDAAWERYRDHQIWERAYELRQSGVQFEGLDVAWIDEIEQKWQFGSHAVDEEESEDWIVPQPTSMSKYTPEQMDDLDDQQLANSLLEDTGILEDWRDLVQRHPLRGARLLKMLGERGEWPSRVWETALFGFRDSDRTRARACAGKLIGLLLKRAPSSLFVKITRTISLWLKDESKLLKSEHEEIYWSIFRSLWQPALLLSADLEHPVGEAINHPIGILSESLIYRLVARKPEIKSGLPSPLQPYFDHITAGEGDVYILSRVILASRLNYLHAIDPEWTRRKLIARFDWKSSPEALLLWKGYLWHPRIDPDLFQAIKGPLLAGIEHLDRLEGTGSNLIRLLAIASFNFPDSLTKQENRRFLRQLNSKQLEEVVKILKDFLEGAGEQGDALWTERIEPWFLALWPRESSKRGPEVSRSLALLAIKTRQAFPRAVKAAQDYLIKGSDTSSILFALKSSAHPEQNPEATLALLDAVLPYQDPQKIWSYKKDLSDLSDRIRKAWPDATSDHRYRLMTELIEKLEA